MMVTEGALVFPVVLNYLLDFIMDFLCLS